jgi:hypothetical protein
MDSGHMRKAIKKSGQMHDEEIDDISLAIEK